MNLSYNKSICLANTTENYIIQKVHALAWIHYYSYNNICYNQVMFWMIFKKKKDFKYK